MLQQTLAILAILFLSGCMAVPRFDIPDTLTFDYELPSQQPMTVSDLMCCYDCNV